MSLITRNAKEYRSMITQINTNLPKRSLWDFLSLRHPNHFVHAAQTIERSSLPTDSSRSTRDPCSSKSRFFLA